MFKEFIKRVKYSLLYNEVCKISQFSYLTKSDKFNNKDLFLERILKCPKIFISYNENINKNKLDYKILCKIIKTISDKYKIQIIIVPLNHYGHSSILRIHI